ncbi:MAG TPA: D-alanine--D-alanine ligase family protein [Bradyrhizobium sp.]|uniref:D-alanine--D-alanine ligase family protein n=1 Tax=Bradyrhizobium sp. TaxID=376 RepID=UPI002C5E396E|nr:D-alanine--D-alanine ligase family protein [Bradyrhizobium sp.]HLZ06823.1 D-alanine--D-alanine ligase family protein [Bradyrhizobium sp.]
MSTAPSKITVGLLFGGRSAEHEVSRASAANVLRALDPNKYDVVLIALAKDGRWLMCDAGNGWKTGAAALTIPEDGTPLALLPGGKGQVLQFVAGQQNARAAPRIDVMFPVLHGPHGEDGTVQGALELADVPYVGSSVMGSAAAMDKDVAKRLARDAGLPIVPFVTSSAHAPVDYATAVRAVGSTDLFVKPANLGSSVGISRAGTAEDFAKSCALAFRYDRKILVERCIDRAREIECSVLEDDKGSVRASPLGEIVPADRHGFYSYEAKYTDSNGAKLVIPADVSPEQRGRIQELAIQTFRVLGCEGMARVDFFLRGEAIFVNEANTLPGFTSISMYPKLWEASGLLQSDLIDILIAHALSRHARRPHNWIERNA